MYEFTLRTERQNFYNVTANVERAVKESGVTDGICTIFCPHTTAGMTINENTDPNVVSDLLFALDRTYPDRKEFHHAERNSSAHLKASTIGSSVTVIVERGKLILGTWQGIYFCEFDGPRIRKYYIKVMGV